MDAFKCRGNALLSALLLFGLLGPQASAQEDKPYTLHVYTNLIQIPALVLSTDYTPLPPVTREQFALSLDSGPPFHPTKIRLAGDDPIALTLVLDAGGDQPALLRSMNKAFADLVPESLTSRDRVDILAFDCNFIHVTSSFDRTLLEHNIAIALSSPYLHERSGSGHACALRHHLWDALARAVRDIGSRSGRRVVLAVSGGEDNGSVNNWNDVEHYANQRSIAIFAVRSYQFLNLHGTSPGPASEDPLRLLCAFTGGLVLATDAKELPQTLKHFTNLLRGRYILEFQRPSNATKGLHRIDIKIPMEDDAYIVASGTTALLPGAEELNDPSRVPNDPSLAPVQGKRRIITHQ